MVGILTLKTAYAQDSDDAIQGASIYNSLWAFELKNAQKKLKLCCLGIPSRASQLLDPDAVTTGGKLSSVKVEYLMQYYYRKG